MAQWQIKNVALRGVTGTVPNNPKTTMDLGLFTQEEADTFDNTVGIKKRYVATDDICASDLCYDAAERLLVSLGSSCLNQSALIIGLLLRQVFCNIA